MIDRDDHKAWLTSVGGTLALFMRATPRTGVDVLLALQKPSGENVIAWLAPETAVEAVVGARGEDARQRYACLLTPPPPGSCWLLTMRNTTVAIGHTRLPTTEENAPS